MNNTPKSPLFFLYHIQESIDAIYIHIQQGKEVFLNNRTIYMAVMRELEIIGEAVSKLPESFKNKYPSIPWRDIKDFRNILAHNYWSIDLETVWNIIDNPEKLPDLRKKIQFCIKELNDRLN